MFKPDKQGVKNMKEKCKKRRILTGQILLMALGMMLWGSLAMAERIFYVKTGGGGDGSSWATALGDVQAAIDAAASGDSVWIATGTYYPSSVRELEGAELFGYSFELKDGVSLYGGFKGNETSLSERRKRKSGGNPLPMITLPPALIIPKERNTP